jgi:hypothetical protein
MDYMLKRIDVFTRFLEDGRICLSNNAAERELRGIALGRKSWLFAGSDRGGERAAVMLTLIQTAKLNNVDPQAWLADVLARIADHAIHRPMSFCRTGRPRWSVVRWRHEPPPSLASRSPSTTSSPWSCAVEVPFDPARSSDWILQAAMADQQPPLRDLCTRCRMEHALSRSGLGRRLRCAQNRLGDA